MYNEYGGEEFVRFSNSQEAPKERPLSGKVEYPTVEGDRVELSWQVTSPTKKRLNAKRDKHPELPSSVEVAQGHARNGGNEQLFSPGEEDYVTPAADDEVIIFLPGVGLDADSDSVVRSAEHFANARQAKVVSISTRLDNVNVERSQEVQAKAIQQFILSQGYKKVTIVGNSQGANKGIDLTYLLEQDLAEEGEPKVEVEGLILTSPGGVVDQDWEKVRDGFFQDAVSDTPIELTRQAGARPNKYVPGVVRAAVLGSDVAAGMVTEATKGLGQFAKRVNKEPQEASVQNPHTKDIKTRIVIVAGAIDKAFNSDKFIPPTAHDQSSRSQTERRKAMKHIFPESAGVTVLEATTAGVHGVHYIRDEQLANVTLYELERMKRREKNETHGTETSQ